MKNIFCILLFLISLNGFAQNFSPEEQRQIDSLNAIIANSNSHDTSLAGAYLGLSEYLASINIDTVIPLCNKVVEIAKNNNTTVESIQKSISKSYAGAINNIGFIHQYKGDVKAALDFYLKCYEIQIKINDLKGLAVTLNNIGFIYEKQGRVVEAINAYHKSLKIREKLNDEEGIAANYINLGYIYSHQGDLGKSLIFYQKSLKIYDKLKNKRGKARCYNNIGYIYDTKEQKDKAILYYLKGLEIRKELGDKKGVAGSLNNIGSLYFQQNKFVEAEDCFLESIKICEETGNKIDLTRGLNNLSGIYYKKGLIKKAEELAKKSFNYAEELGYPEFIKNSAGQLSEIYESENKWVYAYENYKLFIQMRDSLNNEETQKAAAKQQAQYEYEKQKAIDDKEHEKQLAIEQEAKEKQQVITYATAGGLGLVGIFLIFVFNRLQVTKRQKNIIEEQKQEVEEQKQIVETAHHELEEKNQEILDSINYAKRIQNAILPPQKVVKEYLQESFILYKPKDIVAGDFYWLEHKEDKVMFAACDCTGHGVPGAMVSVVCNNGLNRSVREYNLTDPGKILDKTREIVIQEFEKSEEEVKDGMDIALCSLEGNTLKYAGANNPLWIIRPRHSGLDLESLNDKIAGQARNDDYDLIETKANKQPIGQFDNPEPYTTHTIELQKGDTIYIFSDGYADQFGGEKGKKFKAANFKKLLLSIQKENIEQQKELINQAFEDWKGDLEQLDDVCVIGVRI